MIEFIKQRFSIFLLFVFLCSCGNTHSQQIRPAAERFELYLSQLKDKNVALITNQSGQVGDEHLVDFLLKNDVNLIRIFAPEHSYRGDKSDGAKINDEVDSKTGIPVTSLYGKNKKPNTEALKGIDIIVFDIQDVGLRFYTYISTLSLAMEAAAENDISFMVLDRPNPNGFYIDGPVLDSSYSSFVGMHPVPVVYGMTIGEYAQMVKGEGWIEKSSSLDLSVVSIGNYTHDSIYKLPIAPSPNLPNAKSVLLYPSLCFFEPANVSVGRGTVKPFQIIGYPGFEEGDFEFTPKSIPEASKYPKFEGQLCKGYDLSILEEKQLIDEASINWTYLWEMYGILGEKDFYKSLGYFQKLSGSDKLHLALLNGLSIEEFKESYKKDIEDFKIIREKYLLYP